MLQHIYTTLNNLIKNVEINNLICSMDIYTKTNNLRSVYHAAYTIITSISPTKIFTLYNLPLKLLPHFIIITKYLPISLISLLQTWLYYSLAHHTQIQLSQYYVSHETYNVTT